jgi:hypothetical protein
MRIVRFCLLTVFLTVGGLLSVACESTPAAQTTPAAPPAAPATAAAATNPSAEAVGSAPRQIPTASSDKAVIHGIVRQVDTNKVLSEADGVDVFLAQVLHGSDNSVTMSSLDKTTAPRSDPDKNGVFVFADVPPGEYAVIVRSPLTEVVARQANDPSKDLVITVKGGQTLDLGEILTKYP